MIIFLIGFMGSGKTTAGKKLASRLNFDFSDLDKIIEAEEQKSIAQIFSESGEDYFRKLEQKYLVEISKKDNLILATGGGTPCFYENMTLMNDTGLTIYLKMDNKSLINRLSKSKHRPLLADISPQQRPNFIKNLLEKRSLYYSKSKITVNGLSLDIDYLIEKINNYSGK